MDLQTFLSGLAIGFSIAAPVGPIGVLCIRKTLSDGRLHGIVSGLGAATADAVYGGVAALGLTIISNILVQQQYWLRTIGGLLLLFLGLRTIMAKPPEKPQTEKRSGFAQDYGTTFLLTLTNPMTIISFAAVFAGLGLGASKGDYSSAALLVVSVFIGSTTWWLFLSGSVSLLRSKVTRKILSWVNRISGSIILVFGVTAIISAAS